MIRKRARLSRLVNSKKARMFLEIRKGDKDWVWFLLIVDRTSSGLWSVAAQNSTPTRQTTPNACCRRSKNSHPPRKNTDGESTTG